MAINLATKYSPKVVDRFYLESVILGKTSKKYEWDGVESIKVWTINTYAPNDYRKPKMVEGVLTPANPANPSSDAGSYLGRYGVTYEVEDTIQTMTLTQDKAVSLAVDKGNNTEQMLIKNAGIVMNHEMREQFIPMFDKYVLGVYAQNAGTRTVHASLTDENIVEAISDHVTALTNALTTTENAYCFIGATNYAKLVLSKEFLHLYGLGNKALEKGVVGSVRDLKIVPIPDSYLPEGVNFLTFKSDCVLAPTKIKDMKVHQDPPGLSGALLEVRWLYDAFVLETKNKGVIVDMTSAPSV